MVKIIWVFRVRNEEVFHRVNVERNALHKIKRRRTNRNSHNLTYELPYKARYWRKDRRKDRSGGKREKKM